MNMCTALEKLKESGRAEGRTEGLEEGRAEGKREMIFAFLKAGADIQMIKKASGLRRERSKNSGRKNLLLRECKIKCVSYR